MFSRLTLVHNYEKQRLNTLKLDDKFLAFNNLPKNQTRLLNKTQVRLDVTRFNSLNSCLLVCLCRRNNSTVS